MDIIEELQNSRVKNTELSYGELRWACRRGMLELDILLGDFFDNHYHQLSETDKPLFQALLLYPDQELYEYFLGNRTPQDKEINRVIDVVRRAAAD